MSVAVKEIVDLALQQEPRDTTGDTADHQKPQQAGTLDALAVAIQRHSLEKIPRPPQCVGYGFEHAQQVAPKVGKNGEQGTEMQGGIEGESAVIPTKQPRNEDQMSGRRDR